MTIMATALVLTQRSSKELDVLSILDECKKTVSDDLKVLPLDQQKQINDTLEMVEDSIRMEIGKE